MEVGLNKIRKEERYFFNFLKKDSRRAAQFLHLSHAYKKRRSITDFFRLIRSGTVTGAADNDPAGIVTYTQVGAATGFSQLWLMLVSLPILGAVEEMSARIGVVTKKGLGSVIRNHFGYKTALLIAAAVAIANILTIGADMAAMAEVFGIMTDRSSALFLIAITFLLAYTLIRKNYKIISRYLFLITPIFFLYVAAGIMVNPDWGLVLRSTFIPAGWHQENYWLLAVGLLGTTISPYLVFWQTTEEIEEHKSVRQLKQESKGVWLGMAFCHLIFYFIVIASASVFFGGGGLLETAGEAAQALQPASGDWAFLFYSLGIIGSGVMAVPVLAASTGYVIKDAKNWHGSLNLTEDKARSFYTVIVLSLLTGLTIALSGINPIKTLVYSQVLNGFLMPFLLFALLKICNDRKILGKFVNRFWTNLIGYLAIAIMLLFDIILISQWF